MSTVKDFGQNKILGKGAFGVVYECVFRGSPVAVKRIQLTDVINNEREEEALQKLDHSNVIKLFHVESDSAFRYYYLELCNASLDKLFLKEGDPKKYNGPMPPSVEVLFQLAEGLEYIHENGLIHRDIKHENVLIWVNPENNKQVLIKWADFGLSKPVNERGTCSMSGVRGTYDWLAPEILKLLDDGEANQNYEHQDKQRGTVKTDVFAEGLVFGYFLLNGLHVYGSRIKIQYNILQNKPVNLVKIEEHYARELIAIMLADQPENRITSSKVAQELAKRRIKPTVAKEVQIDLETKLIALCAGESYPSVDSIKKLIEEGVDVNCVDECGLTPLLHLTQWKIRGGDHLFELLRLLIRNGVNLNCKDNERENALYHLCGFYKNENLIDIIQLLIANMCIVDREIIDVLSPKIINYSEIRKLLEQYTR